VQNILNGPDREARRTAWQNYHDQFLTYKNTLASNLSTSIKQNVLLMRARYHPSTLEMALYEDNIPRDVFDNLIAIFRNNLPIWHRYWNVRRRALGLDTVHTYDIWAPLIQEPPKIPYEQAVEWIARRPGPFPQALKGLTHSS
jgi:oligoendopeptidase F